MVRGRRLRFASYSGTATSLGGLWLASGLHGLKEHRHHRTHAVGLVERAHGLELQAARRKINDAHAADGAGHTGGGA